MPDENVYDVSQSDISINENTTVNSFSNEVTTIQGPTSDNNEIKSWKAWTMEMPMNDGDILTTVMTELKQAREDYKKFLYARATHSNHVIQPHAADYGWLYISMMEDERDLTPLESNSYKSDLVVIQHIIYMIEVDNFWHQKTFEAVLANLWRNQNKEIYKQENRTLYCKENTKTHEEMKEKEVIDLCGESQTTTSDHWKATQSKKEENHNMEESKTITSMENKNRPEKDFQVQETEGEKVAMMC